MRYQPASEITDAEIEAVILAYLSDPERNPARSGNLLAAAQETLRAPKMQLRRVQRVASDMANRGLLTVEERGAWVTVYPPRGPYKNQGRSQWLPAVAFYYSADLAPR